MNIDKSLKNILGKNKKFNSMFPKNNFNSKPMFSKNTFNTNNSWLNKTVQPNRMNRKNDWDGDGVINRLDCRPRNIMRQDAKGKIYHGTNKGYLSDIKKQGIYPSGHFNKPIKGDHYYDYQDFSFWTTDKKAAEEYGNVVLSTKLEQDKINKGIELSKKRNIYDELRIPGELLVKGHIPSNNIQVESQGASIQKQQEWRNKDEGQKAVQRLTKPDKDGDNVPDEYDCVPDDASRQDADRKTIPHWLFKQLNPQQKIEAQHMIFNEGRNAGDVAKYFNANNPFIVKAKPQIFVTRAQKIFILQELGTELGRVPVATDLKNYSEYPSCGAFTREFGSWNNALIAAGFTPVMMPILKIIASDLVKEKGYVPKKEERRKEYYKNPEIKEKHKLYRQQPESKERKKEYHKEYKQRPEIKERYKKYQSEYYQENK